MIIGTAGWSIPAQDAARFVPDGTSLQRYASRFCGAEINSSFHRPHRLSTWQRWHDSVPEDFRFAVKIPKQITHIRKLQDYADELDQFLGQAAMLGDKLAILLVQLPPKHVFDRAVAQSFFADLSSRTHAHVACEPRHASWFTDAADECLMSLKVARVAADPALSEAAARPGGWRGLSYWRLHGSPVMYRSSYGDRVKLYAEALASEEAARAEVWCVFDNTASSAAISDALSLREALSSA